MDREKYIGMKSWQVMEEMAKAFTKHCAVLPDCTHQQNDWDCEACERTHLKRWLQIVAENDGAIISWY